MKLLPWDELPRELHTDEVRRYYEILEKKCGSLLVKRIFDIAASLVLLVLLSPLFAVLAVAIKLDSSGPVFYRQERVTQYGKIFRIHKFRTMVVDADKGPQVTLHADSRVTRVGRFIRHCRLDETAQLLDTLSGNLTLVGTRPESPRYVAAYTDEMRATLLLPAGVTSLASVYFKDEAKMLDSAEDADRVYVEKLMPAKMRYNLQSVENFSLLSDLRVMLMTLLAVLGKDYSPDDLPLCVDSLRVANVSRGDKSAVDEIVAIHRKTFDGFFLTFMGRGFLRLLYRSYVEHEDSGVIVATADSRTVGFLAYSRDVSSLYRYMLRKRLPQFAWYSLGAFIRRPTVFLRLIRALLKPSETKRDVKYVELASIGVDPRVKSRGVGTRLVDSLKASVDFGEYAYISLETDALDNDAANNFYRKNGFEVAREFETREGRRMLEYHYRGDA